MTTKMKDGMNQAALKTLDSWLARGWREEERRWRAQKVQWRTAEMDFRAEERRVHDLERQFLLSERRYRQGYMRQRRLENSRYLWCRFAELNRRDVEEKSEQLRSLSWLTALIASFTLTSPVEFSYGPGYIPTARLTAYAICAAITPSLMTISSILSIYLLGSILKMGKWFVSEFAEEEFIAECREYAEDREENGAPPAPRQTFERFWDCRCEADWKVSFWLFIGGVASFLVLLCTMAFIKFNFNNTIAILYSGIITIFFFLWLSAQVTWGTYLQKAQAECMSFRLLEHPLLSSTSRNPFKWHICPISRSSVTSTLNLVELGGIETILLVDENIETCLLEN